MNIRTIAALVATTTLLGACNAASDRNAGSKDDPTTQTLRPANEARAENAVDVPEYDLGERITVGDVVVVMNDIAAAGDANGRWVAVTARVENLGDSETTVPYFEIRCKDNDEAGGWQADSTLELGNTLPPQSFDEGVVNLLLPGENRTGELAPTCAVPAFVTIPNSNARVAIPEAVITEVNNA